MPTKPFPFVNDAFDSRDNPYEVQPTADNPRFPLVPPKAVPLDGALTKAGQKFVERLVEATNTGRPEHEQITDDDIPAGLVRMFEAADAAPGQNVSNLASGTIKTLSTGEGDLLVAEVLLNPMALCPDPMNGRLMLDAILRGRRLLTPTGDASPLQLPVFDLEKGSELIDMANAVTAELGFSGADVAPGKDYQDLISVGLQGVHDPILVMPTLYRTPDGKSAWIPTVDDGNRRLSMTMRGIKECAPQLGNELGAWALHLYGPDGVELSDLDAAGVNAVRRAALFGDHAGGIMYPASQSTKDVAAFLSGPAARSMRIRTLMRLRTIRVQLVIGVNPASLSPEVRDESSRSWALVQRVVRRLHIAEAAQKPWSADAQNIQVAFGAMRRVKSSIDAGADFVPLTAELAAKVNDSDVVAWAGAGDDAAHPMRVSAKVLATLACDDHDGTARVKEEMKAFNISVHYTKLAEGRAKLSAERVMPLLGLTDPAGTRYRQVRSVIDRVMRSRAFTDCAVHPGHESSVWWQMIDTDIDTLSKTAAAEKDAFDALDPETQGVFREGADSTTEYGPATRAMVLLSLLALAASPAVASPRSVASPFAITINGLGGTRGKTMTTPDLVMLRVVRHERGVDQMAEILRAAVSTPPRLPRNVIDPEAEDETDMSTKGLLTEAFLRGPTFGWKDKDKDKKKDDDTDVHGPAPGPEPTAYEAYQTWLSNFLDLIRQAHNQSQAVLPGGEASLVQEFNNHGFTDGDLQAILHDLSTVVLTGKIIASRAAG